MLVYSYVDDELERGTDYHRPPNHLHTAPYPGTLPDNGLPAWCYLTRCARVLNTTYNDLPFV